MDIERPTCDLCGQPARVHISDEDAGGIKHRHLCLDCAAAEDEHRQVPEFGLNHAALLMSVGVYVLAISVLADVLHFGDQEEFGPKQYGGLVFSALLILVAAIVRVPTMLIIGIITAGVTILADWTAFGSSPGFGARQMLGTISGVALIVLGMIMARKHPQSSKTRF